MAQMTICDRCGKKLETRSGYSYVDGKFMSIEVRLEDGHYAYIDVCEDCFREIYKFIFGEDSLKEDSEK